MRKKFFLLALLPLLPAMHLMAQSGNELVVKAKTGNTSYLLDNVRRIDLTGGNVGVVTTNAGVTTYAFEDVYSICFGLNTSGITTVTRSGEQKGKLLLHVTNNGSTVSVSGWQAGKSSDVKFYNTSGSLVKELKQWSGSDIDITSLPKGVYIIKVGDKAAKFNK
ncbi:MAG: T9SS type A sorting domain-containing protein [Prevotella sp.]|uniref:T9SS type A sorting domain-containing protein n=1 Tax=Prevotella sp. TaxID=59823 RepID=UPI002A2E6686|nr:T9SS type A sorting domain-containing protein [Prevotella sp.]MDD7317265.1 T9SS type A sorting domain-containing protein [Prevotellaceae bacterium]MDY4019869.1 T9SS type A sorting domain-containing protein [Prevotella sp.]